MAIECGLTLKAVYKLTFRMTEGYIKSLIKILNIDVEIPDYSLLCKRQKTLKVFLSKSKVKPEEAIHILVDTTGLKVFGEGEWKTRQHGYTKRRQWRKLHLAINAKTQEIEAHELTELGVQDGDGLSLLMSAMDKAIDKITGDGAYDQYKNYQLAEDKEFQLITPPRKDAKLTKECTGHSSQQKQTPQMRVALKTRDSYIERIRQIDRPEWKIEIGYHRRSLAETAMFRLKTILGNRLSTRKFENQKVEAAIWCNVINRMTQLGMPISS